jgi:hypothetical protein
MRRIKKYNSEENIHLQVADYLCLQYPDVIFRTDAGGIKLTKGQALKLARLNGHTRAYPDLFIAEPRMDGAWGGLYLELKKEGTRIWLKNGELTKDKHIREQYEMLLKLAGRGYVAKFACGFDEAKNIIDRYLGGGKNE